MKRIALLTMLVACTWGASAQEPNSQEEALKKREIDEIKWSENAVCAEVVEYLADDSEKTVTLAQQKSMQLLQAHVIEIFAKRMNMDKKDVQEIWDVIDDKCQNVEIRKGDIVRVFTYVMKDALGLSLSKPKEKDLKEYFGDVDKFVPSSSTASKPQEIVEIKSDTTVAAVLPAQNEVKPDTVIQDKMVENASVVLAPEAMALADTLKPIVETQPDTVKPVAVVQPDTVKQVEVKAPVKTIVAEVVVPELCQKLLAQKDMTSLLKYLDTEKVYERLIYGNERSMRRASDCYIVIIEKENRRVVTVLDKGITDRMNFVTKQMDNFNNYRSGGKYQAVFVQENK